jgi:hypothetical protein
MATFIAAMLKDGMTANHDRDWSDDDDDAEHCCDECMRTFLCETAAMDAFPMRRRRACKVY